MNRISLEVTLCPLCALGYEALGEVASVVRS